MEIFDYGLEADSEEYDSADSDTDFKPWSGVVHNTGWMGPAQPAHDKEVEDVFEATSLSLKEGVAMLREMADPTMIRMETPAHLLVAGTTLKNFQAHTLTILHHDYQKSKEVRRRNGMLLGQEMGTGKTIVTLGAHQGASGNQGLTPTYSIDRIDPAYPWCSAPHCCPLELGGCLGIRDQEAHESNTKVLRLFEEDTYPPTAQRLRYRHSNIRQGLERGYRVRAHKSKL
jgi:hypothetical protein